MTLLQTRVNDKVASRFKLAARKREMSPYQLLGEMVERVAETEETIGNPWVEHFVKMKARARTPLKQNAVIATREGEDR